jgi:hypothetical protein
MKTTKRMGTGARTTRVDPHLPPHEGSGGGSMKMATRSSLEERTHDQTGK